MPQANKIARSVAQARRRKNPAELVIMANPAELVVMGANPKPSRSRVIAAERRFYDVAKREADARRSHSSNYETIKAEAMRAYEDMELLRRQYGGSVLAHRNPAAEAAAGKMYEQFHGAAPRHTDEYQEPVPRPATLAELGDLIELRVKRSAGWKWGALDFTGQGIKLAANAKGTQLYCVSGNQKISRGQLTQLGVDNSKELIDLGEATYIAYRTRKAHVDNINSTYEHNFGEETDRRPRLMYDRRGPEPRIYFTGGEYRVEAPGIIN